MVIFTGMGRLEEEQVWGGKSRILFGLGRFNICIRYPNVDIHLTIGYMSLKLRRQMGVENISLVAICM